MPESGWNGKYEAVGNGGWTGSIGYSAMAAAVDARVRRERPPTPATTAAARVSPSDIPKS